MHELSDGETVYYNTPDALVTNARAVLAGKTFAMANITSVGMSEVPPPQEKVTGCAYIAGFLAVMLIVGAVMSVGDIGGGTFVMMIIGGCVMLGVALWLERNKPKYTTTYYVNLTSSSGETRALSSSKRDDIEAVVQAVSRAIVGRG